MKLSQLMILVCLFWGQMAWGQNRLEQTEFTGDASIAFGANSGLGEGAAAGVAPILNVDLNLGIDSKRNNDHQFSWQGSLNWDVTAGGEEKTSGGHQQLKVIPLALKYGYQLDDENQLLVGTRLLKIETDDVGGRNGTTNSGVLSTLSHGATLEYRVEYPHLQAYAEMSFLNQVEMEFVANEDSGLLVNSPEIAFIEGFAQDFCVGFRHKERNLNYLQFCEDVKRGKFSITSEGEKLGEYTITTKRNAFSVEVPLKLLPFQWAKKTDSTIKGQFYRDDIREDFGEIAGGNTTIINESPGINLFWRLRL